MATITKRDNGKWQAKCRKKGYKTLSKTFSRKFDAERWAKQVELEMEQGIFESTSTAEKTLASTLLDQFWDEVASKYKSAANTMNLLMLFTSLTLRKIKAAISMSRSLQAKPFG